MERTSSEFYVITGGPGAGKTTLVEELSRLGFRIVPEEGRKIIIEQAAAGGEALPWLNKKLFADLMFDASVTSYRKLKEIAGTETVFFDRGILDTIGYLQLENIPVPQEMEIRAREMAYNKVIFILPPWKDIYENDLERKQTFEVAVSTFECMKKIYTDYGYTVVEVPKAKVGVRAGFILDRIR
ncbi:AAA family ATPase [Chryseobacterium pennipullorum]|uniref:ATPase n=1 Tax=Chryseobacterium pennipullorum TaxID=2258963 RepID=A0A3D9B272_9FLAO|nr:AAA family ATPase [Chryseobacterium pennipullorum]REC47427.1 ATPase [Chryseobacterium pennipullorum]